MKSKWVQFSDVAALISNKVTVTESLKLTYVSTENMLPNCGGLTSLSNFPADGSRANSFANQDTLFSNIRTYFRKVWFSDKYGCASADVLVIRSKDLSVLDPLFLYYLISSPDFIRYTDLTSKGAKMPRGDKEAIGRYEFDLPSIDCQIANTALLASLDDRISLLRDTNATLESIAQALFKSWFVDFDPVRAKLEGRAPEGMDEATAALFPDSFEESELGLVPKGWDPVRLDSFIELAYGKALKAENRKAGPIPVYGSGGITGWHDQPLVENESIVIGRKGTVGSIYWESRPFFPIDTVFYVKASKPLVYCYELLKTLGLKSMNTDAAVPGLNRENVYRLLVPGAPMSVVAAFDQVASKLRDAMNEKDRQAKTLESLRDTLLPRLIYGQLRLPELEEIVTEAS